MGLELCSQRFASFVLHSLACVCTFRSVFGGTVLRGANRGFSIPYVDSAQTNKPNEENKRRWIEAKNAADHIRRQELIRATIRLAAAVFCYENSDKAKNDEVDWDKWKKKGD